jgi:hypothetical protein
MLASETKIFLNFPHESQRRILHPATVKGVDENGCTAELEEANLSLEAGQDLFVYYNLKRKFVKQAARVDAILRAEPTLVVGFQTSGEPMSAESREWFRVSTVMANLTAVVGAEAECRLLDVSTMGFAVEASKRYEVGKIVSVTLRYGGDEFSGRARIQSIRPLEGGLIRYGLHAVDDRDSGGNLQRGQQQISAAIEREQLRRLSRSG